MTAALKQSNQSTSNVRTREAEAPSILDQILDQVTTLQHQQSRPSPIHLRTWEEIERFAEKAARSGMVPKDYIDKPDAIVIAVMLGAELGLAPMQSLQNIAVVNGRPSVWGDALPALCRASGKVRSIREWSSGEGDDLTFFCEAIRKDDPNPVLGKFSVGDAKKASLWKDTPKTKKMSRDGRAYEVDSGPWFSYPTRMLQMRARGFALRDAFPDVLKGLITAEEAADIPFEATGLTPRVEEPKQSVTPPQPAQSGEKRQPTVGEWLDALELELAACEGKDEVDEILARESVQKMQDDHGRPKARDRLQHMLDAAVKRTAGEDDPLMDGEIEFTEAELNGEPVLDALQIRADNWTEILKGANRDTMSKITGRKDYIDFTTDLVNSKRNHLIVRVRNEAMAAAQRDAA